MKKCAARGFLYITVVFLAVSCGKDWDSLSGEYANPGLARTDLLVDFREPEVVLNGVWQRPRAEYQRIVLPVKIKGQELNLIFDTGWVGPVWIFQDQRNLLGLEENKGNTHASASKSYKGELMEVGGFILRIPSFAGDIQEKKEMLFGVEGFDGIMGVDLFRDFKITLKPEHNQVVLSLKTAPEADAQKMEFRMFPRPVVKGSLDGEPRYFLLDTGNPAEGHLGRWNRPAGWISDSKKAEHPLADAEIENFGHYRAEKLTLLGEEISRVTFLISDWVNYGQRMGINNFARDTMADIVGLGVMEKMEIVLNLPRREISLRAY